MMMEIHRAKVILLYLVTFMAMIISVFPIVYLLLLSFRPAELTFEPGSWVFKPTFEHYQAVFKGGDFVRFFMNSLVIGLSTMAIALSLGSFAAYGFVRFKFR